MLKQLSVSRKILGVAILLFAWNLFIEHTFANEQTGSIVFVSDRKRHPFEDEIVVYVIDADGLNEESWRASTFKYGPIAWSLDGKSIAFHLQDQHSAHIYLGTPVLLPEALKNHLGPEFENRAVQVAIIDPPKQHKSLTEQFGGQTYLSPKWSPDGKWLALTSTDGSPDGMTDVCIMDIEGNQLKNLTQSPGVDEVGSWSPDGSKIVFFSNREGNGEIYVMDANGNNQINLTNHPALDAAPTWSPDGTKIAFHSNREGDQDDIYAMNPDGANVVNLTRHPWDDQAPAWSPDGRWIAYHAFRVGKRSDIYVMDANGDNQKQLTGDPRADTNPTWVIPDRSLSVEVSDNQTTLWGRIKLGRQ